MKWCWALSLIVITLYSCSENPKEEVLELKDIIPQSEKYKEGEAPVSKEETRTFGFDLKLASDIGIPVMEVDSFPDPLFPDRFNPRSIVKLELQMKEGVIHYRQWIYRDSLKTMNAFFNWIDCFGPRCRSLKYLQRAKFQSESMLIFLNDTSITYISSELPLKKENWQQYLEKKYGITFWDNVMIQKKNGLAEWCFYGALPGSDKNQFLPLIEE